MSDRGLRLPLDGRRVEQCVVDHSFSLELRDDADAMTLRIESPFTVTSGSERSLLTPGALAGLGPALALFGATVRSATATESGQLHVVFEDGRTLTVEPNPSFEAWGLVGPRGVRFVCTPGGAVATWQPAPAGAVTDVLPDIELDDAPLELVEFDGGRSELRVAVDDASGVRRTFRFGAVVAMQFAPMVDRRGLFVNGAYRRSLLEIVPSEWASTMSVSRFDAGERPPSSLRHFVVPSDDGVWEVLAVDVTVASGHSEDVPR